MKIQSMEGDKVEITVSVYVQSMNEYKDLLSLYNSIELQQLVKE